MSSHDVYSEVVLESLTPRIPYSGESGQMEDRVTPGQEWEQIHPPDIGVNQSKIGARRIFIEMM